jgi:hypothetical protein
MHKLDGLQFTAHAMLVPMILESIYQSAYPARETPVSDPWLFALTRPGDECRGISPVR